MTTTAELFRGAHERLRVGDVLEHLTARLLRVSISDRCINLPVVLQRPLDCRTAGELVHTGKNRFYSSARYIVAKMNKALDEVRAAESRKMAQEGYPPLVKKSRWCVLKHKQNPTSQQRSRLRDLVRYNLQTVRAYVLKEDFVSCLRCIS